MQYSREIDVRFDVDVFVAGGGPGGTTAAIAAARKGKKVLIVEMNGCFGGLATLGLVPTFCQFTDGKNFLVGGIGREIRDMSIGEYCDYKRGFYAYNMEVLKKTYDQLITAEENIQYLFFTKVIDVIYTDDHIDYVILNSKSGTFAVKAKIYIDATGDGDICAMSGVPFEYGNEDGDCMPATLCSIWGNIDYDRVNGPERVYLEQAIQDGVFRKEDRHLPGINCVHREEGIGGGNVGHVFGVNGTEDVSLTESMVEGRSIMDEYQYFYNHYVPGYENAKLIYTANIMGVRESRRIVTDYMLTGEDFLKRACFDDEIGRYAYPVDIHIMKPTKEAYDDFEKEYGETMVYQEGESYGIPYRTLLPQGKSNLLVVGRCIGSDRQMQASVRVMPGCFITGQAAGVAASLACDTEDIRKVVISELQDEIEKLGGIIPHRP